MGDINYTPPPTIKRFMRSDHEARLVMGAVGSGKTTGMIFEIVRRAVQQTPCKDGIRRSRWLATRLTMPQIKDTILRSWLQWFPDGEFGVWKSSDKEYHLKFNDVECEVLFRPLESEADIARVLSLELTGAWVAECRDLPLAMVESIQGRLGRYPNQEMVDRKPYWSGIIGETNPPAEGTEWYRLFEHLPQVEDEPGSVFNCETFVQPSPVDDEYNLVPEAENVENLKPGYYENMAKGKSEDFIRVYIKGQYGRNRQGRPVYEGSFRRDKHIARKRIPIDADNPIIIGMDFGLTPAAVIAQPSPFEQRLNLLREVVMRGGETMGTERFIKERLLPMLRSTFPTNPVVIIGDPAGVRRADSDEGTAFKTLKAHGFLVKPARTNDPSLRIGAVETLLSMYPHGDPVVQIDPSMTMAIEGFKHGYMFGKPSKLGAETEKPVKNNHSHLADAIQYLCLYYLHGYDHEDYMPVTRMPGMGHLAVGYTPADSYTGY